MATYNGEKYLAEQLESLVKQKGVDINILVHDDGSSDRTIDILNQYQKQHILTWFSDNHIGVGESFFSLLRKTQNSDYYAFCDQDDVWDEDKLLIAVKNMEKYPQTEYAVYCCGSRLVDNELNFIKNHYMDVDRSKYARLFFSNVAGNTMVFNHSLKEEVVKYHPINMILHDSWLFKMAICLNAHIIIDKEPHLDYRQHGENVVGMEMTFGKKTNKFFRIINNTNIKKQLVELKEYLSTNMDPQCYELISTYESSEKNWKSRVSLVCDSRINFNVCLFDLAFKLKVLLGKI